MTLSEALKPIAKAAQYFAGAVLVAVVAAMSDGHVSTLEGLNAALAGLTAGAVYVAGVQALKTLVAAGMLGVQFLVTSLGTDGGFSDLSQAQWIMLGVIVANTLGVIVVDNKGTEPTTVGQAATPRPA